MQTVVDEVRTATDLKKTLTYQNYSDLSYAYHRLKEEMIAQINRQ